MTLASKLIPIGCDGKADTGKLRMSLLTGQFRRALTGVAHVLTFGANKYPDPVSGDRSWRTVPRGLERYMDAFERHMNYVYEDFETALKSKDGMRGYILERDEESGLMHIDHAICNLLFLRETMYPGLDGSPRKETTDV